MSATIHTTVSRCSSGAASPTTSSRRRASSAALHRRPFWAKNETALQAIRDPRRESATPFRQSRSVDYGTDNFSYDASHLHHFELPKDVASHICPELLARTHEWIMAGAALMTAIVRIRECYTKAVHCAYPHKFGKPLEHLSVTTTNTTTTAPSTEGKSRRISAADSVMVGSDNDTPPDSIPDTPMSSPSTPAFAWWTMFPDKDSLMRGISQAGMDETRPIEIVGMESPPFTPWDDRARSGYLTPTTSTTTSFGSNDGTENMDGGRRPVDLSQAKYFGTGPTAAGHEGSPRSASPASMLSSPNDRLSRSVSAPHFCERSWEYYLGTCNEHLRDTKQCIMRLKGYGRNIDILRTELRSETTKPEAVIALINFGKWWVDVQEKIRKHERECQSLKVPELDAVEREWYAMQSRSCIESEAISFVSDNAAY